MFTGIVEELGTVNHVRRQGEQQISEISAERILTDLHEGDSINVDEQPELDARIQRIA